MTQIKAQTPVADETATFAIEEMVVYLAKRHRVSPAIVREIIRRTGSRERGAIEREIERGKARR
jgi:hypothetical protein